MHKQIQTQIRSLKELAEDFKIYGTVLMPVPMSIISSEIALIVNRIFKKNNKLEIVKVLQELDVEFSARKKTMSTGKDSEFRFCLTNPDSTCFTSAYFSICFILILSQTTKSSILMNSNKH